MNKIHYTRMLLAGILFFSYLHAGAQVSINKLSDPAQGALLHLQENASTGGAANASAGMLLPRVKLTALAPATDADLAASIGATGSYSRSEHTGLWVYNTHTDDDKGICPGVYVWNGTSWKRQHDPCITIDPCDGMAITSTGGSLTQSICAGDAITSVSLTAGSNITVSGTANGLTVTGSGTTLVTIEGTPTATTTLTAKTGDGSCTNGTKTFTVTRNALPTTMTISGNTICSGDKATLAVTSSTTGLTIKWYDTETATEALHTGTSYTTADVLTTSRSYWVEAENAAGCKLRQKVDVIVNPVPTETPTLSKTTVIVATGGNTNLNNLVTSGTTNLVWFNSSGTQITGTAITKAGVGTYYATYRQGSCDGPASAIVTVKVNPASLRAGAGTFTGPSCFDVAKSNDNENTCGTLTSRQTQRTDFELRDTQDAYAGRTAPYTGVQVYTFVPSGTVSRVRFEVEDTAGYIITSITPNRADDATRNNITGACKVTVTFNETLNDSIIGRSRYQALHAKIYVIYNSAANGTGDDLKLQLNLRFQDCDCCGANTVTGGWLTFMCHNLGADENLDPFKWNSRGDDVDDDIKGWLYQWGRQTDGHQLRASTTTSVQSASAQRNDGLWSSASRWWLSFTMPNSETWGDGTHTGTTRGPNDPCPLGWRIPTMHEWYSVVTTEPTDTTHNSLTEMPPTLNDITFGEKGISIGVHLYLPLAGTKQAQGNKIDQTGTASNYATTGYGQSSYGWNGSMASFSPRYESGKAKVRRMLWGVSGGYSVRCVLDE
ncbi:hypothetical protein M2459_002732 [Parabacteroides sp. PF5-5]|uniref:immunoglobulin domain-containing protein n=1 Tax=unclassified Parabacteroides TaxID=2649774 RepID=UPI002473E384|nr:MULTISPECIES: hypothetical protein [unclassified Parabacteroides]MDH6306124.1 hypothetical protein [Parabacteroides sp. PH5-39]MDH6316978.1 hypothetical protein [Parabacteroides sp. PF5-13]MDH6320731.1 hypothetical protein [Parabacteroides sp. PH5-13]MDH6324567.1 hypothetical protein [Parabacteroides sp. PH5-8]MDH6328163.1 hypothetical protein [Parabacteroides sp. PH5-41]